MTQKVTITLEESIIDKIDVLSEQINLSRSAFISMAISKYLAFEEKAPVANDLLSKFFILTGSAIKGEISPSDYQSSIDNLSLSLQSLK